MEQIERIENEIMELKTMLDKIMDHFSIGKKPARRSVVELNRIADESVLQFRLKRKKARGN